MVPAAPAAQAGRVRTPAAAIATGRTPSDLDPDHEAVVLLSLVDGLTAHTLAGHQGPETALAAFDRHLGGLFRPGR